MLIILCAVLLIGLAILMFSYVRVTREAKERFAAYEQKAESVMTSFGKITYIDEGQGEPVVISHGICGGYDQGFDVLKGRTDLFRIIAPSRFGYPGSDLPENATVDMQADAFAELLDKLEIEKAYVLATSAGGSAAIRFALLHPERCKGLILYCSGYPEIKKPDKKPGLSGPPAFLCNDFCMYLFSPLFKPLMGMDGDALKLILPMEGRKDGIVFDGEVTNRDKAVRYEEYDMSKLSVPVLILHARDDKLASFEAAEACSRIIPRCTFVPLDDGGHMMKGHEEEIRKALEAFVQEGT